MSLKKSINESQTRERTGHRGTIIMILYLELLTVVMLNTQNYFYFNIFFLFFI